MFLILGKKKGLTRPLSRNIRKKGQLSSCQTREASLHLRSVVAASYHVKPSSGIFRRKMKAISAGVTDSSELIADSFTDVMYNGTEAKELSVRVVVELLGKDAADVVQLGHWVL